VREFCPLLLPRIPVAWGSSITGDRTKGTQDLPLVVTTAWVALDFKSSGLEDGVGLGLWKGIGFFGIGDQGQVP
jgi:hypothetical protein